MQGVRVCACVCVCLHAKHFAFLCFVGVLCELPLFCAPLFHKREPSVDQDLFHLFALAG